MDGAKAMAKLVVVSGVVSLWTGVGPLSLLRDLGILGRSEPAPGAVVDPAWTPAPAPATSRPTPGTTWRPDPSWSWWWTSGPTTTCALYHAGAARYQRGDRDVARKYLEEFLKHYDQNDGWTQSARDMLAGT